MTISVSQVSVIIPTLNEEQNIGVLLEQLLEKYPGIGVIVVDDQSRDGTVAVVRELSAKPELVGNVVLNVRDNALQKGITASVVDGLALVTTPYFVVMDGDLQHPPEVVGQIITLFTEGADFVVACRRPYEEQQAVHRTVVTRLATWIAKYVLRARGFVVSDPMSGFFGGRTAPIRALCDEYQTRFEPGGYKILFDLLRFMDPKTQIRQLYYDFGVRPGGHSKLRPAHAFYFLRSIFR